MSKCYLCDLCKHSEYIASNTRLKCHGMSGAIVAIKTIDYGRDDPLEICKHFEPECKHFEPKEDGEWTTQ